jgi:Trk K+ transport system NAD-binding subunit
VRNRSWRPTCARRLLNRLGQAVSRLFHPPRSCVIVVGADARVRLLVTELAAIGKEVSQIVLATGVTPDTAPSGVSIVRSIKLDADALEHAGAKSANCLVVATPDDALNVSLCREAAAEFGVPIVIARLKVLEGVTNWARLNDTVMAKMTWGDAVRASLGGTAPNVTLSRLASVSDREQIVDLELQSPVFAGRLIADLPLNDCDVLALTREGVPVVDYDAIQLRMNDVLTLVGTNAELKSVRGSLATL